MWKYVKFVIGIVLIVMSIVGAYSMLTGGYQKAARQIVENGVDTTGIIEKRTEHTVAARKGRIGGFGRYYTMTYSFTTREGQSYSDEINISKEQAYSVKDGQTIRVRYHANQPSINSALGFEEYITEDDIENVPVATFIISSLLMFSGGGWMVWSSWRKIRPAGPSVPAARLAMKTQSSAGNHPVSAPARSGGKAGFGRR